MKREFVVRQARASDKDFVLRFSRNTFEWGDYIENVWDFWLIDPSGKLLVATFDEKPVGMSHVAIVKRGEAWVEGARVAPEFRRMGVASLLNDAALEWALERGAGIVRAVTDSNNFVAQKALVKMGFSFVSEWAVMEFEDCQKETDATSRVAVKSDLDAIWAYLQASNVFKSSGGLFAILFRWKSLSKSDLKRFIERRMAIIHECDKVVCGLILLDDTVKIVWEENSVQTCYADGDFDAVLPMVRFLKGFLCGMGVEKIHALMLNSPSIVSAFSKSGFVASDRNEFVYEKKLPERAHTFQK